MFRLFRKYFLPIATAVLLVFCLSSKELDTVFSLTLTCLMVPLWVAGSIGATAAEGIYRISILAILRLRKKSLPDFLIPSFRKSRFLYHTIHKMISAILYIAIHCYCAFLMAKTDFYTVFFTLLTAWPDFPEATIHDMTFLYNHLIIMCFMITEIISCVCDYCENQAVTFSLSQGGVNN